MKILISLIGNTDPVRGDYDGPMLHIARHHHPDKVFLLLTNKMQTEKRKSLLKKGIDHLIQFQSREIEVDFINLDADNPARFINFGFTDILDDILTKHPDDEYFVNITSGTPQMIAAMCLELVTNNRNMTTIQVKHPDHKSSRIEPVHEFEYDFDYNLDNLEEAENRCVETAIFSFKIAQQKQILTNKIVSYNYEDALEILSMNPFLDQDDLHQLIEHAYHCDKLRNVSDLVAKNYGIFRSKATKRVNSIVNYFLSWELENKRNDHISVIIRMTPLLYQLSTYILISKGKPQKPNLRLWQKLTDGSRLNAEILIELDPTLPRKLNISHTQNSFAQTRHILELYESFDIVDHLDNLTELRKIEEKERNHIAHQIDINRFNMDRIKSKSNACIILTKRIIEKLFSSYMPNINLNFFEDLNHKILEKIKEIEE